MRAQSGALSGILCLSGSTAAGTMPRSREISAELRKKVVEAHEAGKGYKTISKVFELHRSTVRQIIYKWKVFNTTDTRPRSGRPTKLDIILREVRRSGAGNQNGRISEENGGGRDGREETLCITGTDTSPECANLTGHVKVEDDVLASMKPLLHNDPAGIRTKPKRTRRRKEKTKDLVSRHSRVLASPPTLSSVQAPIIPDAPTTGPAEHHVEVMLCCEICGACFTTETDLESHQAQHLDKILHECVECGKGCKSVPGLKTHMKRKHGCSGEER